MICARTMELRGRNLWGLGKPLRMRKLKPKNPGLLGGQAPGLKVPARKYIRHGCAHKQGAVPSPFWFMTPQDGYDAAYDYRAQRAFMDEALRAIDNLIEAYQTNDMRFHRDDVSAEKAVWMLHMDALDGLRECLVLLRENRHTVASRLFRDIVETLDLASYFHSGTPRSVRDLAKWYQDKFVAHSRVRDQMGTQKGQQAKRRKAKEYSWLSKFTHRTYMVLRKAYCVGAGDKLWFDWRLRKHGGVSLPQTVAQYLATLGSLVRDFVCKAVECQVVPGDRLRSALAGTALAEVLQRSRGTEARDRP